MEKGIESKRKGERRETDISEGERQIFLTERERGIEQEKRDQVMGRERYVK